MKKILLGGLLACGLVMGVQAQTIDIYVNGVLAQEGDTLVVRHATSKETALKAFTIFKNVSKESLTLTGKKTASIPENTEDGWCIWGTCRMGEEISADAPLAPGAMFAGDEYLDFTPLGYVGNAACVTYTFSTKEHPEQTLTFTLRWDLGQGPEKPMKVTVDGKPVKEGQFLTVTKPTAAEDMLHVSMTFENPGSEAITIKGSKKSYLADNTEDTWCMFGSCWTGDDFTGQWSIEPGAVEESSSEKGDIFLEYYPYGYVGNETIVYYTFSAAEEPYNRICFALRWITTGDGTANETADLLKTAVYPNPATTVARLSWEAVEGAVVLNIRNVNGQLLYSRSVEGLTEAEIDVAGFTPGMYFYTLERQGERLGSGKLLVR